MERKQRNKERGVVCDAEVTHQALQPRQWVLSDKTDSESEKCDVHTSGELHKEEGRKWHKSFSKVPGDEILGYGHPILLISFTILYNHY